MLHTKRGGYFSEWLMRRGILNLPMSYISACRIRVTGSMYIPLGWKLLSYTSRAQTAGWIIDHLQILNIDFLVLNAQPYKCHYMALAIETNGFFRHATVNTLCTIAIFWSLQVLVLCNGAPSFFNSSESKRISSHEIPKFYCCFLLVQLDRKRLFVSDRDQLAEKGKETVGFRA